MIGVGAPGTFENTGAVAARMLCALMGDADEDEDEDGRQPRAASIPDEERGVVVVLAHPDHLRRVVRTVETMLAQITPSPPCTPRLLSALQPYHIGWPLQPDAGAARLEGATQLNLFAGVTASVTTHGQTRQASW